MIHVVCDACGKDCDRTALFVTVTPIQNQARYSTDTKPYGNQEKTVSRTLCSDCYPESALGNPYQDYTPPMVSYSSRENQGG